MHTTPRPRLPARIHTDRLILRRQSPADAPLVKEAVDASLAHLQASVAWARQAPAPLEAHERWLAASAAAFLAGESWSYSILDASETRVLGGVAAEPAEATLAALVGGGTIEVGYWLRASAVGLGYASEATRALVDAVLAHLAPPRVAICHDPENVASGGVPRRLGFRCLGVVPASALPGREAADGSPRAATRVWILDAGARDGARVDG